MSSFPNFSNIPDYVKTELKSREENIYKVSNLNAWVRVASGAGGGCQILSNPNWDLFGNYPSIYGSGTMSGTIGLTWSNNYVISGGEFHGYRPKPNITSIEIDEGAGALSRKATFSIICYTRAQLDTLCKYYLEPGYTIFLEWGWNTNDGVSGYTKALNGDTVAENQSFTYVNKQRKAAKGHYDNYLGFITGGSVAMSGQEWTITVKCTGFTELPAFLMASDNSKSVDDKTQETAKAYEASEISAEADLGKKRFMMSFNRLPTNRQSKDVSDLIVSASIANPTNFVNVDEQVKAEMNSKLVGTSFSRFFGGGGAKTKDVKKTKTATVTTSKTVELPAGTEIIGDSGFIKFSAFAEIINTIGFEAFIIGKKKVSVHINTKHTVCAAFPKIFSTDKSKLFIPNPTTPKFSLLQASEATDQTDFTETIDNSVTDGTTTVIFPYNKDIVAGSVDGKGKIQFGDDGTFIGLNKPALQYGFLEDLYVNLDFVKGIIETKNFSIKDALYQILNGISSAAGGLWDFQIQETNSADGGSELSVVDMNMTAKTNEEPYTFRVAGSNSIFMDASLDLDISGAKMNQIIGNRLGQKVNGSQTQANTKAKHGLFTDMGDLVLKTIETKRGQVVQKDNKKVVSESDKKKAAKEAAEKAKEKAMQMFLSKIGYAPKIQLTESGPFDKTLEEMTYITAYNDQLVFESLKNGNDTDIKDEDGGVSALMPIKFSFTIHGVSGIKRGDKFQVLGIPKAYEQTGFFQVLSVKHTITDMIWKTEITGGFRLNRGVKAKAKAK
jgi:hypothetical protein